MVINNIFRITRAESLTISVCPVLFAGGLALKTDIRSRILLGFCFCTAIFLQMSANLINDYCDWKKGVDNDASLKMPSLLQKGKVPSWHYAIGIAVTGICGALSGVVVCGMTSWFLLLPGAVCLLVAALYSAGGNPLSHFALGEVVAFVFFGLVPCSGTFFAMTGSWEMPVVLASVMCGLFAASIMSVNNLRDIESDAIAGKRTVAVVLGERGAVKFAKVLALCAFCSAALFTARYVGWIFGLGVVTVFPFLKRIRIIRFSPNSSKVNATIRNMGIVEFSFVVLLCVVYILRRCDSEM